MPKRQSPTGSELFIVDNSDAEWKALRYLHDWCQLSKAVDIATGYFDIGALLALGDEWKKVDKIRILMGAEVSLKTKQAFVDAMSHRTDTLNESIEKTKDKNDFLDGVPAVVEALRSRKIECRVYRKEKFHAKAYITHARLEVVGSAALAQHTPPSGMQPSPQLLVFSGQVGSPPPSEPELQLQPSAQAMHSSGAARRGLRLIDDLQDDGDRGAHHAKRGCASKRHARTSRSRAPLPPTVRTRTSALS